MSQSPAPSLPAGVPRRVAALAPEGAGWSLVVAAHAASGYEIVHTERLGTLDAAALRRVLSTHRADRLVRVIPPGEAVVRVVELPEGDAASASAAAELIAEAQLPASIAGHRMGGSVLSLPSGSGGPAALLAGWLGTEAPARILEDDNEEFWTPTAGALAGLLSLSADRDWTAQSGWAALKTSAGDAATIVAASASGVRVRSARLADPDEALRDATGNSVSSWTSSLAIDDETEAALLAIAQGGSGDSVLTHALAAGAAIGALRAGVDSGAYRLRAEPPRFSFSVPERAAMTLGTPAVGAALLVTGLALLIGGPLALTHWRAQVITEKLELAEANAGDVLTIDTETLARNKAFIEHLKTLRVAYTKSIAAIAASMPVGDQESPFAVQVERIELTPETLRIRGEASSSEAASQFVSRLQAIGIFSVALTSTREDQNSDLVIYEIEGTPNDTFVTADIPAAFADEPFAVRLFGEDAIGYDYASITQTDGETPGRQGRGRNGRTTSAGFDSVADDADDEPTFPPLSEADIAKMDRETAAREWTSRRRASNSNSYDDETKERLATEAALLRTRLQELQGR